MWKFIEALWMFIECAWLLIEWAGKFFESTGMIAEGSCQAGPYMNFDDSIETLKQKYRALCCQADDVKGELAIAESSRGKKPRTRVENWLANVGNMGNKVDKLLDEAESQTGVAILSRLQYAKQAKDLTGEVEELLKEGEFPQGLTLNTHPAREVEMVTKPLVGQACQENHLKKIWEVSTSRSRIEEVLDDIEFWADEWVEELFEE